LFILCECRAVFELLALSAFVGGRELELRAASAILVDYLQHHAASHLTLRGTRVG